MELAVENLKFSYGRRQVLKGVCVPPTPPAGITAVIGPNAAGKTTFFKCIAGLLRGEGRILFDGKEMRRSKRPEFNKHVSFLPQENPVSAALTVFEAVLLARKREASWRVSDDDIAVVNQVMRDLEIDWLAARYLNELSSGQKQMVSIAQALVRRPAVLLLDEPTSSLDLQHQLEVLELIRRVTAERGIVTMVALHDLNLAARYASRVLVIYQGVSHATGTVTEVLTPLLIREVYGVDALVHHGADGISRITPLGSARSRPLTAA